MRRGIAHQAGSARRTQGRFDLASGAVWLGLDVNFGLEVARASSRSAGEGRERVVYDLQRLSDNLNRHCLNAVVAVTEPIPFSLIRLSITGQIGGTCPYGDEAGLVEVRYQFPPAPSAA